MASSEYALNFSKQAQIVEFKSKDIPMEANKGDITDQVSFDPMKLWNDSIELKLK